MPIVVQRGALDTIMSGKATERRLRYRTNGVIAATAPQFLGSFK